MSFESKQVGIDAILLGSETPTLKETERIFPVSLRVNAESRAETMLHYSFVSLSDAFEDLPGLPKHCVNLGLDCLFVSKECVTADLVDMYPKWLDYLDFTGKDGLAKIKDLEVKEFYWDHNKSIPDHRYEVQNGQLCPGTAYAVMLPLLRFILRLTGLQVLYLTWHRPSSMYPREKWKLEESRAIMQEFVERHKDNFVDGRAPEVQLRYWNQREERYVYPAPKALKDRYK